MKDNKKVTTLILVLVLTITVILGGTFAYWQWITSTEQQTLVNVSLTDDATIYIDFPENEITNMYPTSDCDPNGTSSWVTDITVNNGTGVKLATNFKLKIKIEDKDGNVITNGTNEWNDEPFRYYIKYAVTEENESCQNALIKGRFDSDVLTYANVANNDPHYGVKNDWYDSPSITKKGTDGFPIVSSRIDSGVSFHALPNRETSHRYKVWVWLDKDYQSVTVGNDSTLDKLQDAKVTVSWSENSELEQIRESATPEGEAIAIYSEDDYSLRFYRETNPSSVTVNSTYNGRKVTEVYTEFENSAYSNNSDVPWFESRGGGTIYSAFSVVFEDYIYPISTANWFDGFELLDLVDVTKLDVSNVTNMSNMFRGVSPYEPSEIQMVGLENWDTSNVTHMNSLFQDVYLFETLDLTNWNVCKVTNYDGFNIDTVTDMTDYVEINSVINPYFADEAKCNGGNPAPNYNPRAGEAIAIYSETDNSLRFYRSETPITVGSTYNGRIVTEVYTDIEKDNFDPASWFLYGSVVDEIVFEDVIRPVSTALWFKDFQGSAIITNIENLDTSNVTDMSGMFSNADVIIPNLSSFDISNVRDMSYMFHNTNVEILNVSNWDTSNVTDMSHMFYNANVEILNVSNWDTSNVTNMSYMFSGSNIGAELDFSNWNVCNVTVYDNFRSGAVIAAIRGLPSFGNPTLCAGGGVSVESGSSG